MILNVEDSILKIDFLMLNVLNWRYSRVFYMCQFAVYTDLSPQWGIF
ncbi:hypothetical protein AS4_09800 [Acinetobacter guillouiae]|nr:hypothetical protein AS4_09800 [Acinetobacter guillouiae]